MSVPKKSNPQSSVVHELAGEKFEKKDTDVERKEFLKTYVNGIENITSMRSGKTMATVIDLAMILIEQTLAITATAGNKKYIEQAMIANEPDCRFIRMDNDPAPDPNDFEYPN